MERNKLESQVCSPVYIAGNKMEEIIVSKSRASEREEIYRSKEIINIRMECNYLTVKEREEIKSCIRALQRKRKRDKMQRLLFEINFKHTIF